MNLEIAKLDILKHISIGGLLFTQTMNGLNKKNEQGYFLAKRALEVIYDKVKIVLKKNHPIISLLKKILSRKKFLKDIELSKELFKLLEKDFKLLNSTNKTLYKLDYVEDFYFDNK